MKIKTRNFGAFNFKSTRSESQVTSKSIFVVAGVLHTIHKIVVTGTFPFDDIYVNMYKDI